MEFTTYVRKPFTVDAVEITEDNIAEIAERVGTLRQKEDGTSYIQVNRRLVPNIYRVYPGFFMTELDGNVRCYSKRVFESLFVESSEEVESWINYLNSPDVS